MRVKPQKYSESKKATDELICLRIGFEGSRTNRARDTQLQGFFCMSCVIGLQVSEIVKLLTRVSAA